MTASIIVGSGGQNGLLALTHGALHGRRKTMYTIFGGALGFVAVIALSMFGIGALLQASLGWLTVMKWVGGAYLAWLGIVVWRSPPSGIDALAAFLPQFIDPARSLFVQFLVMAGTFAATEVITETLIASMAHRISPWLRRVGRRFNLACGGLFVAIGVALPLRG
ncbi:MAG: LysE family translocator [Lautropia sp.]|nr:LysE family translocator [Lautropia sp.]MCL4701342.1 LysE family transporter [Burkholderiaceae bacterium]MDL1907484.1 LysE family translocator [Betaproteobacteria bacterium PRO1]RIK86509.1 MAG: lysine transporter LysE [Burkholderiales bacterium]